MHYSCLVLLPKRPHGKDRLYGQLNQLLAPYWEELETDAYIRGISDMPNPDGKWDWWQLGGRWHGFFEVASERGAYRGEPGTFNNSPNGGYDATRRGNVIGADLDHVHAILAEGVWREKGWAYSIEEKAEAARFDATLRQLWEKMPPEQWLALVDYHR